MKKAVSLKVAAEDKSDETISKSTPTFMVDPRSLVMRIEENARPIDRSHVEEMKVAKRAGAEFPALTVVVIDGERVVKDGNHRLTMYLELIDEGMEIRRVQCVEMKSQNKADHIMLMLGSASGLALTPLQRGVQYADLVNGCGWTLSEVAGRMGKSVQHVRDCVRLTEQPAEIQAMIKSGEVTASTALKTVKAAGVKGESPAAALKEGLQKAKERGKKGLTQKDLDNAGKSVVKASGDRAEAVKAHLSGMLESPSIPSGDKVHIKAALAIASGQKPPKTDDTLIVINGVMALEKHANSLVRESAQVVGNALRGERIPPDSSPEAKSYGRHVWLQEMSESGRTPALRKAAHWFLAVLDANRSDREVAPAPSVLSLADAMQAEIDAAGAVLAETLCPEYEALISAWRGL